MKTLGLFFSPGVSLEKWVAAGPFDREVEIYREHLSHGTFGRKPGAFDTLRLNPIVNPHFWLWHARIRCFRLLLLSRVDFLIGGTTNSRPRHGLKPDRSSRLGRSAFLQRFPIILRGIHASPGERATRRGLLAIGPAWR